MHKFRILRSNLGYAKLSDGALLGLRVAIFDVKEFESLPTGPRFLVGNVVQVSVLECPNEVKELVKSKPIGLPGDALRRLEIWELLDITESAPATEECEYCAHDGRTYLIIVEVEPTIVARTLEYRDEFGNPIYHVRWSQRQVIRVKRSRG